MTAEEKQRQQGLELEKIADQLKQQQLQPPYNPASSWAWMSGLEIDIVKVASDMLNRAEELLRKG